MPMESDSILTSLIADPLLFLGSFVGGRLLGGRLLGGRLLGGRLLGGRLLGGRLLGGRLLSGCLLGGGLLGGGLLRRWPCHGRWQHKDHRFKFRGHFTVEELDALNDYVPCRDDIFGARSITGAGNLEQKWQVAKIWMAHERSQTHDANRPFVNVGVTVSVTAQIDLRVVQMEAA